MRSALGERPAGCCWRAHLDAGFLIQRTILLFIALGPHISPTLAVRSVSLNLVASGTEAKGKATPEI